MTPALQTPPTPRSRAPRCPRRLAKAPVAFSLVEAVLSLVILTMMTGAALTTVAAARRAEQYSIERTQARGLAEGLMSEVLALKYREGSGILSLGLDLLELPGNRADFDDIDDFDGYRDDPPTDRDRVKLAGLADWSRTVQVRFVSPSNLANTSVVETGVKRIDITVNRGARAILTLTAFRSLARDGF